MNVGLITIVLSMLLSVSAFAQPTPPRPPKKRDCPWAPKREGAPPMRNSAPVRQIWDPSNDESRDQAYYASLIQAWTAAQAAAQAAAQVAAQVAAQAAADDQAAAAAQAAADLAIADQEAEECMDANDYFGDDNDEFSDDDSDLGPMGNGFGFFAAAAA